MKNKITDKTVKMDLKPIPHITKSNRYEVQEKYNNSEKYNYTEFCDHCGRGIKGEPAYMIHMANTKVVIIGQKVDEYIHQETIAGRMEDMGYYAIGSECVKVYHKEYRYKSKK